MAEGLQRKIEYADLKLISSFAMEKILDFQTWEVPGEHARGVSFSDNRSRKFPLACSPGSSHV